MVHDNKEIERLTGELVKNTPMEEPSALFTERVMQSVFAAKAPVVKQASFNYNYYWLLLTIPAVIAGGWYISVSPVLMNKIFLFLEPLGILMHSIASVFTDFLHQLINISVSPMILIGSAAVLSLLVFENLITREEHQF